MSSLSIFPTEILEWITNMVMTSEQIRLWQCGDRILNFKLKNGGLKRTVLCWPGHTWMPWPRSYFTTFDGIVDVEWRADIGSSFCPTLELNLLPTTLKRLHLDCKDVFVLLRQQNINMQDILPMLLYLRLFGIRLKEENLKNLPSHLIELHVASLDAKIESSHIFGDLPRQIERLTLGFWIVDESELENDLPSGLISLEIYRLECYFNWFSKLPRSVKMLHITVEGSDPNWLTLPPQLEEFHLGTFDMVGIPKSVLRQLPQSLKTLEIAILQKDTTDAELGPLPQNLTKLAIGRARESVTHSDVQLLPATLTDFNVPVSATHPDLLSFYPPASIRMRIWGGPFSHQLNLFPFPTNLRSLTIEHVNDAMCAMLPPKLQTLNIYIYIGRGLITVNGASKLPKSLTSLTAWFEIFDDNETMSHLRTISHLELRSQHYGKMNEHWISSLLPSSPSSSSSPRTNAKRGSTSTHINEINPHLTSFKGTQYTDHLGVCPPYIKKLFFDSLPRFINLKTLQISRFSGISADWLCLIPKTVTELYVSYLKTFPTETQLSTLLPISYTLRSTLSVKKASNVNGRIKPFDHSLAHSKSSGSMVYFQT